MLNKAIFLFLFERSLQTKIRRLEEIFLMLLEGTFLIFTLIFIKQFSLGSKIYFLLKAVFPEV